MNYKKAKGIECQAGCGKRFMNEEFLDRHITLDHPAWKEEQRVPKQRGWATPYGFGDWAHPVTYEFACQEMKRISETVVPMFKERKKENA